MITIMIIISVNTKPSDTATTTHFHNSNFCRGTGAIVVGSSFVTALTLSMVKPASLRVSALVLIIVTTAGPGMALEEVFMNSGI